MGTVTDMKRYGWTEKGIIGGIFAPFGLIFLVVGLLFNGSVQASDERLAFLICFVGIGGVFLAVGLVLLGMELRRRARQRAAYEGGYCVMGRVAGCRVNTRVNVNGTHPMVVEVHWTDPDTGTVHVFYSRNLYFNVEPLLTGNALKDSLRFEVPVYLDRGDKRVGFVDIDAVLPRIEVHG